MYRLEILGSDDYYYFSTDWDLLEFALSEWGVSLASYSYLTDKTITFDYVLLIVDNCIRGKVYETGGGKAQR